MRSAVPLALGLVLLSGLLFTCRGSSRQTYHVTAAQLEQMGKIAGIAPCKEGPTLVLAVKRARDGGGVVHVECPLARKGR